MKIKTQIQRYFGNLFLISALTLALIIPFFVPLTVEARSGCCSWHGGVCGCGCCDGTPLSATCAPYYPECGGGYSYPSIPSIPSCPSMSSYDSLLGSCKCYSGYVVGKDILGKESCVSGNQKCHDDYGYNSSYSSLTNKCECDYGYMLGSSGQCVSQNSYCQNIFGYNSEYNILTKKCECSSGYVVDGGQCKSGNSVCWNKYGYNSSYNNLTNQCECSSGYVISSGTCVSQDQLCKKQLGLFSSYNSLYNECECDSGYFLNNSQCVAVEISSIYPTEAKVGDEVTIKGENFGDDKYGNFNLYVGSTKIYTSDISKWENEKIIFIVGDYIDSDYVKIKNGYYIDARGPYLEIVEISPKAFILSPAPIPKPSTPTPQVVPQNKPQVKVPTTNDIKKEQNKEVVKEQTKPTLNSSMPKDEKSSPVITGNGGNKNMASSNFIANVSEAVKGFFKKLFGKIF